MFSIMAVAALGIIISTGILSIPWRIFGIIYLTLALELSFVGYSIVERIAKELTPINK
jgi:putative effector of murein hydrolase LrgA (UPF0299 family)